MKKTISTLIAMMPAWLATEARAMDLGNGLEFNGYLRVGAVSERQTDTGGVNKYALGSGAELFRLGNEGDTYLEAGLRKTFQLPGGITWAAAFTGTYWNGQANFRGLGDQGMYVTKEAYVTTSGYAFSPAAIFWAGKRYIEREDVHIVDHFFYSVGGPTIDTGIGATNIPVGDQARLGVSVLRSGQRFSPTDNRRDATRLNVDFYNIPVTRQTILSHAEVQPTLGIKQRGKWDIAWLPGRATATDPIGCGDHLRKLVAEHMAGAVRPPAKPTTPSTNPIAAPLAFIKSIFGGK